MFSTYEGKSVKFISMLYWYDYFVFSENSPFRVNFDELTIFICQTKSMIDEKDRPLNMLY
jgi:hypothetical protein